MCAMPSLENGIRQTRFDLLSRPTGTIKPLCAANVSSGIETGICLCLYTQWFCKKDAGRHEEEVVDYAVANVARSEG